MKIETYYQKETIRQIKKLLESIEDDVERLSQYLSWIARAKYLIELKICWDLQGFDDYISWIKLMNISLSLTKQEFAETQRQINECRKFKDVFS